MPHKTFDTEYRPDDKHGEPCPYCASDNPAIRDTYYNQNCRECVRRMTPCRGHANWQVCPDCCSVATRYPNEIAQR